MNKPDLEKATKDELKAYIACQESVMGGVSNLIAELKVSCDILAQDVKRANEGKEDGFILLNDGKNFQRIMTMVKNVEFFKTLENGKEVKEKGGKKPIEISETNGQLKKPKLNVQDFVIKA
jgi:hypothetical protein